MKLLFTSLLILYTINSFSQQKEHLQDSIPANDSIPKDSISRINLSNLKFKDSISLHLPDTLSSSIFTRVNKLDEVFINSKSEFNAVSLGILKKEIKPLTTNERRLYTAGDFKPIHLLSILGGTLPIDPIINKISGRTKRLKRYIQLEKKESNIIFLEDHFSEYILTNLNVPKEIFERFMDYLIENEKLQDLIDRKDFGELHFLIGDEWFKFQSLQHDSTPVTTDKVNEE